MPPTRRPRTVPPVARLAFGVVLWMALAGCQVIVAPPGTPAPAPTLSLVAILRAADLAPRDDAALARDLLLGGTPVPRVAASEDPDPQPGDTARFWLGDPDTDRTREITATLRLRTAHLEMWAEQDTALDEAALRRSAEAFESRIYPTLHETFGAEWSPGVDGNPRLAVLNARVAGAAGYFTSANEYPRLANPTSNAREMFVMNVQALSPGTGAYEAVLAHEYQHMIHWSEDPNEDAWLNEGLSELAEVLAGYPERTGRVQQYAAAPGLPLTHWDEGPTGSAAHYGASYLFVRYLYDRLGAQAIRMLVAEPRNGMAGVEQVLVSLGADFDADTFLGDWVIANALLAEDAALTGLAYDGLEVGARATLVAAYPGEWATQVHQYGTDYYALQPQAGGSLAVTFRGQPTVPLLPDGAASGQYRWWSNRGDNSHATLERTVDLSAVRTATLTVRLWYDLEEGWDYAYLRASADGGATWTLLRGAQSSDENPHGSAYGPGYTGRSGGGDAPAWVTETVDLSALAGHSVLLHVDVVTDDSVNGNGLCLDDLTIPEIGWRDDVERGDDGWRAQGFIRDNNALPQRYIVQLATWGEVFTVQSLLEPANSQGAWRLPGWGADVQRALLAVTAVAPSTSAQAPYTLTLEEFP